MEDAAGGEPAEREALRPSGMRPGARCEGATLDSPRRHILGLIGRGETAAGCEVPVSDRATLSVTDSAVGDG